MAREEAAAAIQSLSELEQNAPATHLRKKSRLETDMSGALPGHCHMKTEAVLLADRKRTEASEARSRRIQARASVAKLDQDTNNVDTVKFAHQHRSTHRCPTSSKVLN